MAPLSTNQTLVKDKEKWEISFDEKFPQLIRKRTYEELNVDTPNNTGNVITIRCENEIKSFITSLLQEEREEIKKIVEKTINNKEHVCRFNDGESNCECYNKALSDLLSHLNRDV